MHYSYIEIEYVATSFSPTRTDLAVKLLNPAYSLGHFDTPKEVAGNQSLSVALKVQQGTPQIQVKILRLVMFQADPLCGILQTPPKSSFKHLILETLLWQCPMSSSLKSPPEGLKNAECGLKEMPKRREYQPDSE